MIANLRHYLDQSSCEFSLFALRVSPSLVQSRALFRESVLIDQLSCFRILFCNCFCFGFSALERNLRINYTPHSRYGLRHNVILSTNTAPQRKCKGNCKDKTMKRRYLNVPLKVKYPGHASENFTGPALHLSSRSSARHL